MSELMLTCRQVTELVSRAMDGQVPVHRRMMARMHLFMCRYCSQFKEQMETIREACRRQDEPEGSLELSAAAVERIRCAMASERHESD